MPPHPHPIPCPTPSLTPRVLPALGQLTLINISAVWLCPFQRRGQGRGLLQVARSVWPHSFLCPPTPHPFIVNSHFCTGFEPGDVGSHFFFLCVGISGPWRHGPHPGYIWENPRVCPLTCPTSAKDFKKSVLLLEGRWYTDPLAGRWERRGKV